MYCLRGLTSDSAGRAETFRMASIKCRNSAEKLVRAANGVAAWQPWIVIHRRESLYIEQYRPHRHHETP